MPKAHINLWEVMTAIQSAKLDSPYAEKAEAVQKAAGKVACFHQQEIDLDITENGWKIGLFGTEGLSSGYVSLIVDRNGHITVERRLETAGITETRRLEF